MVQRVLACLDKLPVTLAALQPPCELGRMVGRLRKNEGLGTAVAEAAKQVVARWKAVVDQATRFGGDAGTRSVSLLHGHSLCLPGFVTPFLPFHGKATMGAGHGSSS